MNSFVPNSALWRVEVLEKDNLTVPQDSTRVINESQNTLSMPEIPGYSPVGIMGYTLSSTVGDGDGKNATLVTIARLRLNSDRTCLLATFRGNGVDAKIKLFLSVLYLRV